VEIQYDNQRNESFTLEISASHLLALRKEKINHHSDALLFFL
jgi:hypothetical protein